MPHITKIRGYGMTANETTICERPIDVDVINCRSIIRPYLNLNISRAAVHNLNLKLKLCIFYNDKPPLFRIKTNFKKF